MKKRKKIFEKLCVRLVFAQGGSNVGMCYTHIVMVTVKLPLCIHRVADIHINYAGSHSRCSSTWASLQAKAEDKPKRRSYCGLRGVTVAVQGTLQ